MIRSDCRHFVGYKPCKHKRVCEGCDIYDKIQSRILIIKLGALGDLLRTTPILPSLKARYPGSQITWLTQANCLPLLENLSEIDRLWVTDSNATPRVLAEKFDLLICFDKDVPAAELAQLAQAKVKMGFARSEQGALYALNSASRYALDLGLSDELKFRKNTLTYQQIIHQMAELPVQGSGPDYQLRLRPEELKWGRDWLTAQVHDRSKNRILGLNPGAGRVFATKKWHPERFGELATRLHREHGIIPLLLGGADETALNERLHKSLRKQGIPVLRPGEDLTLRQFASLTAQCDGFVAGDTLGMHLALAMKIPTVALFLSTCAQEIELYGRGQAIVGEAACAPCYLSSCSQPTQYCANSISVDQVFNAVISQMEIPKSENLRHYSHL